MHEYLIWGTGEGATSSATGWGAFTGVSDGISLVSSDSFTRACYFLLLRIINRIAAISSATATAAIMIIIVIFDFLPLAVDAMSFSSTPI